MCDKSKVWIAFGMIAIPLAVATGLAIAAMATNSQWWLTWLSAALVLGSLGAVALATAAFWNFSTVYNAYYSCMQATGSRACTDPSTATLTFQITGFVTAIAALVVLGFNALKLAGIVGAAVVPIGIYLVALAALIGMLIAMGISLAVVIGCLERPVIVVPPPPPPPVTAGSVIITAFTCTLNKPECGEGDVVRAIATSGTNTWQTAPTCGVLLKGKSPRTIITITGSLTDGFGNTMTLGRGQIKGPNTHHILNSPAQHAIFLKWSDLSGQGIGYNRSNRKWSLKLMVEFDDQSTQSPQVSFLIVR